MSTERPQGRSGKGDAPRARRLFVCGACGADASGGRISGKMKVQGA
ncbi:hypothetical protein Salmuc_03793 [Salipiger mucosus DSM 16094]|uniref:Uncharacterized protein n=1 Tax=Salipiger mucosus DSM 16094 TaxID=1123237 RepID=S9QL08_9RHOB|nr:hypothetical protein Salmuc_03793 [Salipiger mucosus DSM 16094]